MAKLPTIHDAPHEGKTLVYGLGVSGLSVARYLQRENMAADFVDSRDLPPGLAELKKCLPDATVYLGQPSSDYLDGVARVIVSPGIADSDPFLRAARRAGVEISSDIDLFVAANEVPFAAVTGSNGKSTVATLLALMCDAAGRRAVAGANLGEAALDLLLYEDLQFCVLELSSFQLQRCDELPADVAVLLNISPDHLDWHVSEDEYRSAKYKVFSGARSLVWNRDDKNADQHMPPQARRISFATDEPTEGQYGIVSSDGVQYLARGAELLMPAAELALVGNHNQANALAALAAGELIGLDMPAMLKVLHEFTGLPHRMQPVRVVADVHYINDSKATNVAAAVSAVESFEGPVVLIAGGQGKGGDFAALATGVQRHLRAAVLIGEDAPLIAAALGDRVPVYMAEDMRDAVTQAATLAVAGDTVLLAPACASFDQFENFQKRGDSFTDAVRGLGQ